MKVSLFSVFTLSLMLFGASVSWTQKTTTKPPKQTTQKTNKKKPTTKRKRAIPTSQVVSNKKAKKQLTEEIKKGIRLLKKKQYESFLKRFIAPSDTKKILGVHGLKAIAPQFGRYKAAMLLAVFEWIKTKTPTFSQDRKRAVYHLKGFRSSTPKQQISFVKENGVWYVKD